MGRSEYINMTNQEIILKYIGKGVVPPYPAKDLTQRDVDRFGGKNTLLATGLYQEVKAPKKKSED